MKSDDDKRERDISINPLPVTIIDAGEGRPPMPASKGKGEPTMNKGRQAMPSRSPLLPSTASRGPLGRYLLGVQEVAHAADGERPAQAAFVPVEPGVAAVYQLLEGRLDEAIQ